MSGSAWRAISDDRETNRRLWNGYMGWKLSDKKKADIRDRDGNPPSFPELSDEEKERIEQHFNGEKLPDPNYDNYKFGSGVDFSHTRLPNRVNFSGFIFPMLSNFMGASFGNQANFSNASFATMVCFENTSFGDWTTFDKASFGVALDFNDARFGDRASFRETTFWYSAQFQRIQFKGAVYFTDVPPSSEDDSPQNSSSENNKPQEQKSIFRAVSVRLHGLAKALRLIKDSSVANARPTPRLDFSNATFGGKTDFTGRHFAEPPLFFEAKLHEQTYFDEDIRRWPKAPKSRDEAGLHIKAYQRLSLLMREQQKREDKHLFDSLEARARRVKEGPGSAFFWGSYLYQWLANYGYGLWRTVIFWLANMGLGAGLLLQLHLWGACKYAFSGEIFVAALIKSLLNAHPFLVGQTIETWTNQVLCSGCGGGMIELVQSIFGSIFFFFLLLTLRNRFRF